MLDTKIPSINNIIFNTSLSVRIYDINYGNHLGHDSVISLFHEARVEFLKKLGFTELDIGGVGILITNLLVNYLGEAFYSDVIEISIGIGDTSKTSIELIYQAINKNTGKDIARALTTVTFYDYQRKKVAKIPEEFMRLL